jgi:hypothetical protein
MVSLPANMSFEVGTPTLAVGEPALGLAVFGCKSVANFKVSL